MKRNWYTGLYPIHDLGFFTCKIETIETNAFVAIPFMSTTSLSFHDQYSRVINYQPSFLNGLVSLRTFVLDSVVFVASDAQFLISLKSQLENLIYLNATTEKMLYNSFVDNIFVKLRRIVIKHTVALYRLGRDTFGLLPSIVELELDSCGITIIQNGTFALMINTLQRLSLKSNHLQTIPIQLFVAFSPALQLLLEHNPWKCQCVLLELNERHNFLAPAFHRKCNQNRCRDTDAELNFDLRTERSCIYHSGTGSLFQTYPKFWATLSNAENVLQIHSHDWNDGKKVYIVILMLKSFVFENEFQSVCFIGQRQSVSLLISLKQLVDRTQPHLMHIMADMSHRVWPLNVMSIRPTGQTDGWIMYDERVFWLWTIGIAGVVAFVGGAVAGFVLLCCYPILIRDLDRVVVLSNQNVGGVKRKTHVFIMPRSWKEQKPNRVNSQFKR